MCDTDVSPAPCADAQAPAPPPECDHIDCHAPATVRLQFDSEPEIDWYYCNVHAGLAIDAAWAYGETVIVNERIDVAEAAAADDDGPKDPTDPDLPPVPPPPSAEAEAILTLHARADAGDVDAERTLARMDAEGAYAQWRGFSVPDTCEVAGCSRPATRDLTDENATAPHMRYLCAPHAAARRALAARPGARFHITNDVRIAEAAR